MKVVFFDIQGWEKSILTKALKGHDVAFFKEDIGKVAPAKYKDADVISVFIYSQVTAEIIKALPSLKLITTRSTGFDHVDTKAASARKIPVASVPFYGENTVAEHTFALILSLSRNIHKSYMRVQRRDYSIDGLKGFDLKGRTLGIVGTGHIGLHVIRMAKGFGMNVLGYDVHQDHFISEVLGFQYVDFDTLLGESDIISLHAPYNEHTHHMINQGNLDKIKPGALLINTSRGGLVETEALIKGLDSGIIAGAGLDVLEGEELIREEKQLLYDTNKQAKLGQLIQDHWLINHDHVVFTPHIAFYSQEALERIIETTADNIVSFISGKARNVVNL